MSLDRYLDDLRDDGAEGEEGAFSLALGGASWKLSRFRLARPQDYPTHLVACAVAGGATSLEIQTRMGSKEHHLEARFDGDGFTLAELEELSSPLSALGNRPALRELSIVLNVLGSVGTVSFRSAKRSEVRIQDGEISLHKVDSQMEGQILSLSTTHLTVVNMDVLASRCYLAPLQLTLNGKVLNRKTDFGASQLMLFGVLRSQNWDVNGHVELPETTPCWDSDSSVPMVLAAGWPTQAQRLGLQGLVNGVLTPIDSPDLQSSFLSGVVELTHLKRDLSGSGFVLDDAYLDAVQQIRTGWEQLLSRICETRPDLSPRLEGELRDEILQRFQSRPIPEPVRLFLGRALITDESNREERLMEIARQARKPEGESLFQAVRAGLRGEAGEARRRGFLHLVGEWLEREGLMLEEAGHTCSEWSQLNRYWSYLLDKPVEGAGSDGEHFRDLLCIWGRLERGEALERLSTLETPACWKALLLTEASWQAGAAGFHPTGNASIDGALEFLSLYEAGQPDKATGKLESYLVIAGDTEPLWRELVYQLYRGRVSFTHSVAMTARRSFNQVFGERLGMKELLQERSGHHHQRLFGADLFSPELLPKLYLRLGVLRQRQRGDEALLLLTRVLLQLSLGNPSTALQVPEELPSDLYHLWQTPVGDIEGGPVRPRVGTVTSGPVSYQEDAFAPLSDEEAAEWGL